MKTTHIPNCWICGRAVSLGNSRIDENHLAVHESCYVAKMALEKGQSQPSTVAKEGQSQRSTPQSRLRSYANRYSQAQAKEDLTIPRCRRLSDFWITSDPRSWLISRLRFRVAGATGSLFLELHRQVNERPSRDFNSWDFNSLGKLNESAMGVKQP